MTCSRGVDAASLPNEPVDARLLRGIAAIERAGGATDASARGAALAILAGRDEALDAIIAVEPPPMRPDVFRQHVIAITDGLGGLARR